MRILRIENRTLTELADDLLKIKLKEGIPKGSVILYGSNAYLGVVSAECYAAECAKNWNWTQERLGDVLQLTSSGVVERCVLRGLLDISTWFDSLPDLSAQECQKMLEGHIHGKEKEGAWMG